MKALNARTPQHLRAAANHLRNVNQRQQPTDVTDALRVAVVPETKKDLWHAIPPAKCEEYEEVYGVVMEHYRMAISEADRDPDLPDVLDKLAERAELEAKLQGR